MRGATCFLFKIFQTNRLLPLPCFPLWGKCLRKQTIEVNFNFLTLIQPSPWRLGVAVRRRMRGHFPHRSKCVQTTERSQFNYFPLHQMQIIRTLKNRGSYYFLQCLSTRQSAIWSFFRFSTSANSIAVEKFRNLCYNNKQARQVCQNA